jgi:N-acyl-L-homoserine lactone synthetase
VKIATKPSELDGLFKTRHKVFVQEEGYLKQRPNGRIFDEFDAFPSTVNLVAMVDRQVVGGLRLTEWSEVGTPSDDFFDFSPYLPRNARKIASASMLCLRSEFRVLSRVFYMLLSLGTFWAISRKLSHVVATINPRIGPLVRSIGFKPVDSPFHHDEYGVDVLPAVIDLKQVEDSFHEMAKFQGFHGSLRTFDREFYRAGERIIECGSNGDAAYVIIEGEVTISRPGRRADDPPNLILSRLGCGEIFGELSFLTNKPQSADASASKDVDLMVVEREVFIEQLHGNPDLQFKLLQLLGHRLADTIERLPVK